MRLQFCTTHFALRQGELPCAWPDCSEGSPDVEIEFNGTRFSRESWRVDQDHEVYFWHQAGIPYAYHLRSAAIHELRTLQGRMLPLIWHYTSMAAFKSIVETNELWLTDIEYLNDATELAHGFSYISKKLREADLGLGPENSGFEHSLREMFVGNLDVLKHLDSMPRISVTCFAMSEDGDDLTQWKGYGDGATGIAIGFDRNSQFFWDSPLATLGRVIYDDRWKDLLSAMIARYIGFAVKRDLDQEGTIIPKFGNDLLSIYENVICDLLMEISVFIKDYRFNQESEMRFAYNRNITRYDEPPRNGSTVMQDESRFRLKNEVIIQYFGSKYFDLPEIIAVPTKLPIKEVVIGPKSSSNPMTQKSIKEFLRAQGFLDVDVRPSLIPFR